MNDKVISRGRGRPVGSGTLNDAPALQALARYLHDHAAVTVWKAIPVACGERYRADTHRRRLNRKWKAEGKTLVSKIGQEESSKRGELGDRTFGFSTQEVAALEKWNHSIDNDPPKKWQRALDNDPMTKWQRSFQGDPVAKAMADLENSAAMQGMRALEDSPLIRAMKEMRNGPMMSAVQHLQLNPAFEAMRKWQELSSAHLRSSQLPQI